MTPRTTLIVLVAVSLLVIFMMLVMLQGCGDLYDTSTGYTDPTYYGSMDGCEIQARDLADSLFSWEGERSRFITRAVPRCRSRGCYGTEDYGTKPSCSAMWQELIDEFTR